MSVRINTNIEALNAQRNLGNTSIQYGKSVEKLSSGLRINRAADDAAGLAISEKLRAQVKGLNQAQRNAQDGISMVQTAEGALNEVHSMLQRMRELAVQASNSTLSQADSGSVNTEIVALQAEINRVANTTQFNGQYLLTGALGGSTVGALGLQLNAAVVGATTATDVGQVTALNVAAAGADTYAVTGTQAGVAGATATTLTLTALALKDAQGNALKQTVTLSDIAAGASGTINFDSLGISVTIAATVGGGATGMSAVSQEDSILAAGSVQATGAGGSANANFQIGANATDSLAVQFANSRTTQFAGFNAAITNFSAAVTGGAGTAANVIPAAQAMIGAVDTAIANVSQTRGTFGAVQNRLEHTIASLGVSSENLSASESRIRDLDVAAEMVTFTKTQILQQAGTAILAQANQAPQSVLSLLK